MHWTNGKIGIIAITDVAKWNGALVTIITPTNIINVIIKLINSEITPPTVNTNFGAAVLFKILIFPFKDIIDTLVAAVKKSKIHFPDKK